MNSNGAPASFIGAGTSNISRIQQMQQQARLNTQALAGPTQFDPAQLSSSMPEQKPLVEVEEEKVVPPIGDDHDKLDSQDGLFTPVESAAVQEVSATCEFCNEIVRLSDVAAGGVTDAETIADALDIHYIDSCKMLTSCNACDKVIEINRLTTHMLNECELRDRVKQC